MNFQYKYSNSNFGHTNDMKPLFYCTAFCAEGARLISTGQRPRRYRQLQCGPGIKVCHSEEANPELYCLVENNRPTKNLTFPKAQSVFFRSRSVLIFLSIQNRRFFGRRGFNLHFGKIFSFRPSSCCESLPQNDRLQYADQVLKFVILRRPTPNFIVW
jgi:hypothetical protein